MKKTALLLLLLAAVLTLSGCNLIGFDSELDRKQVVASVQGTDITKGEWLDYRDYMVSYMQQYYQQNYGMNVPVKAEDYGDTALEQLIQNKVLEAKRAELGISPLGEEDAAGVESYADSMMDLYKMMIRYQNYPGIETVEEEQKRLAEAAEATPSEATPAEAEPEAPKATMTDAELDEKLTNDLAAMGYTRDYFVQNRTASLEDEKLHEYTAKDVTVSDEEIDKEIKEHLDQQKETYDATPTAYASAVSSGTDVFYVPEGYRGVKNLLIQISEDDKKKIDDLNGTIRTSEKAVSDANSQIEQLTGEEAEATEEAKAAAEEQIAALRKTAEDAQTELDGAKAELETAKKAAFEAILPDAEAALARAKAGEDFDALIAELGKDPGMNEEPNKSRGYLVCEGLTQYEQPFQDAAMALKEVGDLSELVETSYGYHILQYASAIEAGELEVTQEQRDNIRDELLETKKEAAYEAAVTGWVSDAQPKTFPKVMK